jgi:hypothetical protein
LRDEVRISVNNKTFQGSDYFYDISWQAVMAYLCDISTYLNDLNLSKKERAVIPFKVEDKWKL